LPEAESGKNSGSARSFIAGTPTLPPESLGL
jgi:hypothetical protein